MTNSTNPSYDKMMGVFFGGGRFTCCVCQSYHNRIDNNDSARKCYYDLVRKSGGSAREINRRARHVGPPSYGWSASVFAKALWPAQFKEGRTLDLWEYRYALAADKLDDGIKFLKQTMSEWADRQYKEEKDVWASNPDVNVEAVAGYGGMGIRSVPPRTDEKTTYTGYDFPVAPLNENDVAMRLMKDEITARILTSLYASMEEVKIVWNRVKDSAKMTFLLAGQYDKDKKFPFILTRELGLRPVPQTGLTVQEAEALVKLTDYSGTVDKK